MGIFDIPNKVKEFCNDFDSVFNEVMHDGKEYFGYACVQCNSSILWKIRVRWTGDRGRYLKIDSKTNSSQQIRATADDYQDYVRITPDEWEVFSLLASNRNDKDLYYKAKSILSRITRINPY